MPKFAPLIMKWIVLMGKNGVERFNSSVVKAVYGNIF
jgi:hypothetical protein